MRGLQNRLPLCGQKYQAWSGTGILKQLISLWFQSFNGLKRKELCIFLHLDPTATAFFFDFNISRSFSHHPIPSLSLHLPALPGRRETAPVPWVAGAALPRSVPNSGGTPRCRCPGAWTIPGRCRSPPWPAARWPWPRHGPSGSGTRGPNRSLAPIWRVGSRCSPKDRTRWNMWAKVASYFFQIGTGVPLRNIWLCPSDIWSHRWFNGIEWDEVLCPPGDAAPGRGCASSSNEGGHAGRSQQQGQQQRTSGCHGELGTGAKTLWWFWCYGVVKHENFKLGVGEICFHI